MATITFGPFSKTRPVAVYADGVQVGTLTLDRTVKRGGGWCDQFGTTVAPNPYQWRVTEDIPEFGSAIVKGFSATRRNWQRIAESDD